MPRGWKKGKFIPKHPEKYIGDVDNIIFRSSWEQSFCQSLDNNPNILKWNSEEIAIPYVKPTTGRVHKYYPDFWVKYKNKHGQVIQEMIEIKPAKQTRQPTIRGKRKKYQLQESLTFEINKAKWTAAQLFCTKYGIKFRIVTEHHLFKT